MERLAEQREGVLVGSEPGTQERRRCAADARRQRDDGIGAAPHLLERSGREGPHRLRILRRGDEIRQEPGGDPVLVRVPDHGRADELAAHRRRSSGSRAGESRKRQLSYAASRAKWLTVAGRGAQAERVEIGVEALDGPHLEAAAESAAGLGARMVSRSPVRPSR